MEPLGKQWLVELSACEADALTTVATVRAAVLAATRVSGATVLTDAFRQFSPAGVSGVVIIAESHVTIHTWPEHRYAAVDVFTCGRRIDVAGLCARLETSLGAQSVRVRELERGPGA